ncbi:MAG TPA: terminase family protein [Pyrinomonadaceae bacterium]|nr:terminase family protein [Pyrinomonadaceae bacterium]
MSTAPLLPPDWQTWPEKQRAELLTRLQTLAQERDAGKVPWLCTVPGCDGLPHKGRMGPHARADQRPPDGDEWDQWVALAGRGWGKTRTGAEWAIAQARVYDRGALVGPTAGDARDVLVEGESGIMACAPTAFRPVYEPSKRRLTYPNGAQQAVYSADEPDRLRGPQHHYAWADELAAWKRLQYAWDMLMMGLRLGDHPRVCVTTTPRPLPLIKELVKSDRSVVVRGSTYDNLHNLAPTFRRTVLDRYAGTVLGRQELDAEILEDLPGALVRRASIESARVDEAPDLATKVVAVDPAGTGTGDEAGVIVAGLGSLVKDVYILADYSAQMSARQTGLTVWEAFYEHEADYVVYEDNFGKQWLRDGLIDAYADYHNLDTEQRRALREGSEDKPEDLVIEEEDENGEPIEAKVIVSPFTILRKVTAQHGKVLRAQPVAMRYEQGRVHHVGTFPELEDQETTWNPHETPNESPDRVDALVHGATYLMKLERGRGRMSSPHGAGVGRAAGIARTTAMVRPPQTMIRRHTA